MLSAWLDRRSPRFVRRLWLAGALLFCGRWLLEAVAPMHWTDNKAWFYIRDYLALFPAALCWYTAAWCGGLPVGGAWTPLRQVVHWCAARPRRTALLMAWVLMLGCLAVSVFVYRTAAHILDEADYLFQAKIFATGRLFIPPPDAPPAFFRTTYIIMQPDRWYSSFFPGPSLSLVPGVLVGAPYVVNPFLSGVLLLVTVWAGARLFDTKTGLLAGVLMLLSPFVLLQGASYFSHILTALLFVPTVVWLLDPAPSPALRSFGAGLCAGGVLLCRPLSAAVLAAWALVWWSILLVRGTSWSVVLRRAGWAVLGALPGMLALLLYNWALTGHPLLTPHEVALPDERIGPGIHMLTNTGINLVGLSVDLLGVPVWSLVPLALFIWAGGRWRVPLVMLVLLCIGGYSLYPYHGLSYGPRFYFESAPLLLIATASGLLSLPALFAARPPPYIRSFALAFVLITFVISLGGVLPGRVRVFGARGAYFDIRVAVAPALRSQSLVFVRTEPGDDALAYLAAFAHIDVRSGLPALFARDLGPRNQELMAAYPDRAVYWLDVETDRLMLDAP
jgi:hypothetical protein